MTSLRNLNTKLIAKKSRDDTESMAFIVFWSSLVIRFGICFTCFDKSLKITRKVHGSLLIIMMTCSNGHRNIWRSQPSINRQSLGNILISSATLFSANTFQRIFDFFHLVEIQCIGKTRFYEFQRRYLAGVVQERYCRENNSILNQLKEQGSCRLSGDGRCDSSGHNAKYLTYSFLDQITNKIAAMTITQVTEAKNSNNMEKVGFIKGLTFLRTNGVTVDQRTTDRHSQIRKHMRENEKDTIHQFDIWHFCKSIKKAAATKKKPCQALNGWIKSIINHLWWAVSTCDGDETLLREKWCSILFHIQNKHKWSSCSKFHRCVHPTITKSKARKQLWLNPTSDAFKALQSVVLDKHVIGDLKYLTKFSHTGILEIFHVLYDK